jgi:hypothetical protein
MEFGDLTCDGAPFLGVDLMSGGRPEVDSFEQELGE